MTSMGEKIAKSNTRARQAALKNIVEAREGRAPMPLATHQNTKGIGAAVIEVARPAGHFLSFFRCVMVQKREMAGAARATTRAPGARCL